MCGVSYPSCIVCVVCVVCVVWSGLGEEGLFRISGNKATMEDLQLKIDCGMDYNLEGSLARASAGRTGREYSSRVRWAATGRGKRSTLRSRTTETIRARAPGRPHLRQGPTAIRCRSKYDVLLVVSCVALCSPFSFAHGSGLREESLMADYLAVMLPASLPRENYDLLKSLFLHFHKVVQHKDITKMVPNYPLHSISPFL